MSGGLSLFVIRSSTRMPSARVLCSLDLSWLRHDDAGMREGAESGDSGTRRRRSMWRMQTGEEQRKLRHDERSNRRER